MKRRRQFGSIRKLPSGRWQARHRETVTNRLLNAPTTFATKAAANRYLVTVETDIARGVWHDPRHGDLTFAEWVQRYLSVAGHKAATTRSRDETVLRVHLVPAFGPQRLAAIAPLDVQHIVNVSAARGRPITCCG